MKNKKNTAEEKSGLTTLEHFFTKVNVKEDIYKKALNNQLAILSGKVTHKEDDIHTEVVVPVKAKSEPKCDQSNIPDHIKQYIAKIEAKLKDEEQAKSEIIKRYQSLHQKYVRTLATLVRVYGLLNERKTKKESERDVAKVHVDAVVDVEQIVGQVDEVNSEKFLSTENIDQLESLNKAQKYDSTFVRDLLSMLYHEREDLRVRSISGRSKSKSHGKKSNLLQPRWI